MRPISVQEQDQRLRASCPEFKLVLNAEWIGIWEGPLTPICQTYRVRIVYFTRRDFGTWWLTNAYASVTVLDPPLGTDPRGTGERVPHSYALHAKLGSPRLCLYDPVQREWQPD